MITEHSPFKITEYKKCVTVTWPTFKDIKEPEYKNKLVDAAFRESKAYEVGFCVELNNNEYDILWIDTDVRYLKEDYSKYLLDMYVIKGVAFRSMSEAEMFHKWIEGKYIWQLLKN